MLPRTPMIGKAAAPTAAAGPRQGVTREAASLLAGLVRVQPVFNQGKLQGYRIFPGGAHGTSAFTQLGLKSGDLIEAVNGTALDDAARAMEVLQTLSSSAAATVTVSRNGQSQEVNLNLANLNLESDAAENAAAGQGADQAAPAGPASAPFRRRPAVNMSTAPDSPAGAAGNMNAAAPGADASAAPTGGASGNASSERDR
jgi:membrane-associated protease RseP (regulator of RpoE activity)